MFKVGVFIIFSLKGFPKVGYISRVRGYVCDVHYIEGTYYDGYSLHETIKINPSPIEPFPEIHKDERDVLKSLLMEEKFNLI